MEWVCIFVSLCCMLLAGWRKLGWPTEFLVLVGILCLFSGYEILQMLNLFKIHRLRFTFNLLSIQRKKISNLESSISVLKNDNKLLVEEITGLHKIWMHQNPPEKPAKAKPSEASRANNKSDVQQITFNERQDILDLDVFYNEELEPLNSNKEIDRNF